MKKIVTSLMFVLTLFATMASASVSCFTDDGAGTCTLTSNDCTCMADALANSNCDTVLLSGDITHTGWCFAEDSSFSNKILDCQDHTVEGDGTGGFFFMRFKGKANTIQNCNLKNYQTGIHVKSSADDFKILNNTFTLISNTAIRLDQSDGHIVKGNDIHGVDTGISVGQSYGNTIESNLIIGSHNSGVTIYLARAKVIDNKISQSKYGIRVERTTQDNLIQGNKLTDNEIGINIGTGYDTSNVDIELNEIKYNGDGILLGTHAHDNIIENNNIYDNVLVASGVHNDASTQVDATLNYWGCLLGPNQPGCETTYGDVSYQEWLCEEAPTTWVSVDGVCLPNGGSDDVPEFTMIGAGLALLGAGIVGYRKRK